MEVVCGEVADDAWGDLLFAWRVCKHVSSNAIVLATRPADDRDRRRPDEPRRRGADRGREGARARPRPRGAVLASDAFFPFADGPQLALDAGIAAIIQPGGSRRDDEVTAAVEAAGAAMVFTGRRHFRH